MTNHPSKKVITPTTLNDIEQNEDPEYLEEIGNLVFQSALLRFLVEKEEAEAAEFEKFIEEHADEDDMIVSLFSQYPEFEKVFEEELKNLSKEMSSMELDNN